MERLKTTIKKAREHADRDNMQITLLFLQEAERTIDKMKGKS